jgi:hypothetical protein
MTSENKEPITLVAPTPAPANSTAWSAVFGNGQFEVGISAGADPGLPDSDKLSLLDDSDPIARARHAAAAILEGKDANDPLILLEAAGAYYVAAMAWIAIDQDSGAVLDGDAILTKTVAKLDAKAEAAIKSLDGNQIITLVLATKANWYAMNHHVGQKDLSGFALKCYNLWFTAFPKDKFKSAAWRMGHRASTWAVMHIAGHTFPNDKHLPDKMFKPKLAPDVVVRFHAAPAGAHKANVFHAAAVRMVRSPLFRACPDRRAYLMAAAGVPALDNIQLHIGARYLGFPSREFDDKDYEPYLGRSGTFIAAMFPKSDLAKSPLLMDYQKYEDFSPDFKALCDTYRVKASVDAKSAQDLIPSTRLELVSPAEEIEIAKLTHSTGRLALTAVSVPSAPATSTGVVNTVVPDSGGVIQT